MTVVGARPGGRARRSYTGDGGKVNTMTTLAATRKLIQVHEETAGTLRVHVEGTISKKGRVTVNGQPVGYMDTEDGLGWQSVYQHFGEMMLELRRLQRKRDK